MMEPLSLYIHWPFCRKKCPYCDFNSHVREEVEEARWQRALLTEMISMAKKAPGRKLASIFFGGGTPSLMPPALVKALIDHALTLWPSDAPEITLEANPTSSEAEKFAGFREAGVNRLSLGVQSLCKKDLDFLGREHSADEAMKALGWAKQVFPRYSFDLIYARPEQTVETWQEELAEALEHAGKHLSLYQLTIEPETPFARFYRAGDFVLPEEETAAELYETTARLCAAKNLFPYEVSNYAAPGEECRHNLTYWEGREYLGIGPGTHGRYRDTRGWHATTTLKSPERWIARVEELGDGLEQETPLTPAERFEECVMTGIRLRDGFSLSDIAQKSGHAIGEHFMKRLKELEEAGFLTTQKERVVLEPKGRLLVNAVVEKLLT